MGESKIFGLELIFRRQMIKSTNRASVKDLNALKIFQRIGNNFICEKFYRLTVSDGPIDKMAGWPKPRDAS